MVEGEVKEGEEVVVGVLGVVVVLVATGVWPLVCPLVSAPYLVKMDSYPPYLDGTSSLLDAPWLDSNLEDTPFVVSVDFLCVTVGSTFVSS